MTGRLPLEGVRIVALEQYISGPYCTMWLADCGAEVIKVERPEGDPRRGFQPQLESPDGERLSGGFFSFNRNKKSIVLDLRSPGGIDVYRDLVATADVVVENMRPGATDALGVGPAALVDAHPTLIYAAITGYGRDPSLPFAGRPAFDAAILGMSGITALTGADPDGPPGMPMYGLADMFTGVVAGYQILMALFDRQRTGCGRILDVSMYDALVALNERPLMHRAFTGRILTRGPDPYQAPFGCFRAADGYISLVTPTDLIWRRLAECIGRPDLGTDPRTATGPQRASHPEHYRPALQEWIGQRTRAECVAALEAAGVPAGVVQDAADVAECPHLDARGMFVDVDDPAIGLVRMPHAPIIHSDGTPTPNRSVPRLGEHTEEILAELGRAGSLA
jgi:CoA:oxalate CoA-transferase